MMPLRWRVRTLVGLVVIVALGFKGVLLLRPHEDVWTRREALARLVQLPRPANAEATLVAALDDPEMRQTAILALVRIGSTSPALIAALVGQLEAPTAPSQYPNRWTPVSAVYPIQALKMMKLPAATIAPLLRKAMASPDRWVRLGATLVLCDAAGRPGPPAPLLAQLLLVALQDQDEEIRLQTPEALARLDEATRRQAVAILLKELRQPDRTLQFITANSLSHFDPEAGEAALILAERLQGNDLSERIADLSVLGQLGPAARPVVPAIVQAMTSRDATTQVPQPLIWFGAAHDRLRLISRDNTIRSGFAGQRPSSPSYYGAWVLEMIGPEAEREALEILTGMVLGEDRTQRLAAIDAIGAIGRKASALIPILLEIAERERPERELVDRPLGDIESGQHRVMCALLSVCDGGDPRFVAALVRMIDSLDPQKRHEAAFVLNWIDPSIPLAVPGLIRGLKDKFQPVRFDSADALGRSTGPEREAVISALLDAPEDLDENVNFLIVKSLARLHGSADRVVPKLVRMLRSERADFRFQAAEMLGRYGPDAKLAIPALREARLDSTQAVRDEAAKALEAIEPAPAERPLE